MENVRKIAFPLSLRERGGGEGCGASALTPSPHPAPTGRGGVSALVRDSYQGAPQARLGSPPSPTGRGNEGEGCRASATAPSSQPAPEGRGIVGALMRPIRFAQIEPVGQCNLRCRMCPIQFRQDGPPHGPLAFMELATFQRVLDELPDLETLHLQGMGEPLMHPQFFEMVRYATARGVRVTTNTNLTLLSARRARLCVESGLAELHASLDGATAATYERIRMKARFTRVKRHLETLLATRRELGSETPRVRLVMVLMRDNLHELPALVELAHALGVNSLFAQHLCHDFGESSLPERYLPMRAFVDAQTLLKEDPARVAHYFDQARARASALGLDLRLPRAAGTSRPNKPRCDWPWRGPYVSYQGDAMPCCMVGTPDRANLGNVARQGVQAVWNGKAYTDFRTALASDQPPEVCRSCAVYRGEF